MPKEKEMVIAECRLCNQVRELQKSHITPDFVYRWMRETAPTGKFRDIKVVNRPIENGETLRLLCSECEQIFGKYESEFSKKFFFPFHDEEAAEFEYEEWLLRCGLSIVWRQLVCRSPEAIGLFPEVREAERVWREFLLNKRPHPGLYGLSVFALGLDDISGMETRFFNFISRSISGNLYRADLEYKSLGTVRSEENIVVVSKVCRVFFVGLIKLKDRNPWRKTKAHLKKGHLNTVDCIPLPPLLVQWISAQADKQTVAEVSLSDRQKKQLEHASIALRQEPRRSNDRIIRLSTGEEKLFERARSKMSHKIAGTGT